jgi:hypothetical protein
MRDAKGHGSNPRADSIRQRAIRLGCHPYTLLRKLRGNVTPFVIRFTTTEKIWSAVKAEADRRHLPTPGHLMRACTQFIAEDKLWDAIVGPAKPKSAADVATQQLVALAAQPPSLADAFAPQLMGSM